MEKKKFFDHTGSIPFVICNVLWVVASVVNIYADMHNVFSYHEHYTFGDALRTVLDCCIVDDSRTTKMNHNIYHLVKTVN